MTNSTGSRLLNARRDAVVLVILITAVMLLIWNGSAFFHNLRIGDVEFMGFFGEGSSRREVISTFLALLELVRMRAVRALQSERFGPIFLTLAVPRDAEVSFDVKDDYKG